MKNDVIILTADLNAKKENIFKSLNNNSELIDAISQYANELKENNIEIWERKDNILITENGYFLSVFPEAIKEVIK